MSGMNNVTGFDPEKVKTEIWQLYYEGKGALGSLFEEVDKLFTTLSKSWYSPNALAFSNKYRQYILDLFNNSAKVLIELGRKATNAYNAVASANGYDQYSFSYACISYFYIAELKEVSPMGTIGMTINTVKEALVTFRNGIYFGINKLDNLPKEIDLYDPGSEQRNEYIATLAIIRDQISSDFYDMIDAIKVYMEKETNEVFRAAAESAEMLRG